jgi:hypothetical protein
VHINGGFAFAETPCCPATRARLLWDARYDASVLTVEASPALPAHHDVFDLSRFWDMATVVFPREGGEHIALSDGYRRIRIDVGRGTLCEGPVHLHYELQGLAGIEAKILTLRRLLALCRLGRFARNLHPPERLAPRWVAALRAYDAVREGGDHREIAIALYGEKSTSVGRESGSDFLRLRVQRLARTGRYMASGGYRTLLR